MANNLFVTPQASAKHDYKAFVDQTPKAANGARWFWWIAALSAVNTLLLNFGSDTSFVIGLGFTIIADTLFQAFKPAAFVIDIAAIGFFGAMGFFGLRGHRWAFIVGGIMYLMDALIYARLGAFMPIAFHAWALFGITSGLMALNRAIKSVQATTQVEATPTPLPAPTAVTPPEL